MKTIAQIREAREDAAMMRKLRESRQEMGALIQAPERATLRDELALAASEEDIARWIRGPVTEQIEDDVLGPPGAKRIVMKPINFSREQARYRFADAMLEARKK